MRGRARALAGWLGVLGCGVSAAAEPVTRPTTPAEYAALGALPDWSGVWQPEWATLFASRAASKPVLRPDAANALARFEADKAKGENLQSDSANCVPPGMPQIMRMPYPIEFLYSPGRVTIAIETESQVRRIYTDGRRLPDDPDPTFNGASIGHWEGADLVAETIGLNPKTSLVPGVHPSDQARIVERFHLVGPDRMEVTTTVTDPKVLVQPLVLKTSYVRRRDWQIREYVCQENNRDAADPFGRPSLDISKP